MYSNSTAVHVPVRTARALPHFLNVTWYKGKLCEISNVTKIPAVFSFVPLMAEWTPGGGLCNVEFPWHVRPTNTRVKNICFNPVVVSGLE